MINSIEEIEYWDSIASIYNKVDLNPLTEGVDNPLWKFVKALEHQDYKRVADLGCGNGKFAGFLSTYFSKVWAIDYSDKMLKIAKARHNNPKIVFKKLDMRDLRTVYNTFDIAFSINSILPSNPNDVPIMLSETFKTLHAGGLFVSILPSFDTILYLKDLTFKDLLDKGINERNAKNMVDELFIEKKKLDEELGLYADDGVRVQKFLHIDEIRTLLPEIGFRIKQIQKVVYPWELCRKYGYGYFPGKPEIWDWFVVATKSD